MEKNKAFSLAASTVQISPHVYVIKAPTNIGVIETCCGGTNGRKNSEIYLVDTGHSSTFGECIYETLKEIFSDGFTLKAIINTHGHSDHAGGNAWLAKKTGCEIWATHGENAIIENPELEMMIAWGGIPFHEIASVRNSTEPSHVTNYISYDQKIETPNGTFSFLHLPGHTKNMAGVYFQEKNSSENQKSAFFLGDAIFGREMLRKYWIPFVLNIGQFKNSLSLIPQTKSSYYIPSHGEIVSGDGIDALVELNLLDTLDTEKSIMSLLASPHTAEEILKSIADMNHIPLHDTQFVLIGCTIRSYLTYLQSENLIAHFIKDNKMLWQKLPED